MLTDPWWRWFLLIRPEAEVTNMLPDSDPIEHPPARDSATATVLKSLSLVVIIAGGLLQNAGVIYTIVKNKRLHRAPYYYMINLSVADLLRSAFCLPFVLATVLNGSKWRYGNSCCTLVAFSSTFFMFGALFALFILAMDRHVSVVHRRFHSRRLKGLVCLAVVLVGWGVAFLLAFPPVFGLGTYNYIPMEAQCTLEHRYYQDNDTFGFALIFVFILGLIVLLYVRIFRFLRSHRKMRPVLYQPARSDNWAFFGPGANVGLLNAPGANNFLNGFARAVTNPAGVGQPQNQPHMTGRYLFTHAQKNEHLTRVFVAVTILYDVMWVPYVVVTLWLTLDKTRNVPYVLVTVATWLSYLQVALLPLIYIVCHRPFRRAMTDHANAYIMRDLPQE